MLLGWDIGGVNTKVGAVEAGRLVGVREAPFELQRAPDTLPAVLRRLASSLHPHPRTVHAVTMTAELSQMFRSKREGVCFVLDAVEAAFPGAPILVFTVSGQFIAPVEARRRPFDVAAANWMATALVAAVHHRDVLLIDTGTTTTDLVAIAGGVVAARGTTDFDRLAAGELVYSGAVRTPVEAVVREVTVRGARVAVSAEGFALTGDVYVWRGDLDESDYDAPAPDGRPATRQFAGERLRRVVCADREQLDDDDVSAIAESVAHAQIDSIAASIRRVIEAHPTLSDAVVTGRGAFLGKAAALVAGLRVASLSSEFGEAGARSAPAVAVALICERSAAHGAATQLTPTVVTPGPRESPVAVVVKIGGGALRSPEHFAAVLGVLDRYAHCPLLIVPGGGPFADAVRSVDRQLTLADDAAHWMAIRAMDVFAELLVSRLPRSVLVHSPDEVRAGNRLAVLAPFQWVRGRDPLPHTWDVTGDSIAAWIAGVSGARHLVLVKPAGAAGTDLADPFFSRALPADVIASFVAVDSPHELEALLSETFTAG